MRKAAKRPFQRASQSEPSASSTRRLRLWVVLEGEGLGSDDGDEAGLTRPVLRSLTLERLPCFFSQWKRRCSSSV